MKCLSLDVAQVMISRFEPPVGLCACSAEFSALSLCQTLLKNLRENFRGHSPCAQAPLVLVDCSRGVSGRNDFRFPKEETRLQRNLENFSCRISHIS